MPVSHQYRHTGHTIAYLSKISGFLVYEITNDSSEDRIRKFSLATVTVSKTPGNFEKVLITC